MKLGFVMIDEWPKLAWLARCVSSNGGFVEIFHGSEVETHDDWFCEAVWDGDFQDGGFDRTDIIAGSGGRLRGGKLTFVSSGTTVDRIQSISLENRQHFVSNSLSCILAAVGGSVAAGYAGYWEDFGTIINGIDIYKTDIQSSCGSVQLVYFNNLVWDGRNLRILEKPGAERAFESFDEYHEFLKGSIQALAANMSDSARWTAYELLGTLSSGYDSTAVTALAVGAGCAEALSFTEARSGEPDNGNEAARALGIKLHLVERENWKQLKYPEVPFIASDSKGEDRYFCASQELLNGKVLLTGFHGDKMWDKHTKDVTPNIVRGDRSGLSLTEFRLRAGFINCAVPFWGVRRIKDVVGISNSEEMKPWDIPGTYSRPICRRISETAGIPREAFGMRKRAASEQPFASSEFLTPSSMRGFLDWAKTHRWELVRQGHLPFIISLKFDRMIFTVIDRAEVISQKLTTSLATLPILWRLNETNFSSSILWKFKKAKTLVKPVYLRKFLFPWALEQAKKAYRTPPELRT